MYFKIKFEHSIEQTFFFFFLSFFTVICCIFSFFFLVVRFSVSARYFCYCFCCQSREHSIIVFFFFRSLEFLVWISLSTHTFLGCRFISWMAYGIKWCTEQIDIDITFIEENWTIINANGKWTNNNEYFHTTMKNNKHRLSFSIVSF